MLLHVYVVLLLFHFISSSSLHDERRQIIERVKNYLQQYDVTRPIVKTAVGLENSNKIGFGYNLLSGSPVCYTGECQTAGFTRSIFKLNYSSAVPGSCTNKLIPNNVDLDCLPSTSLNIDSEIIDTVEQLHKSISNKVQISGGVSYMGVGFSYEYSKETRHMLDNIIKNHQTSIVTKAQISWVKLSMFEPEMELSDNFKYVIENMPCCEVDDPDIEEYVKDFIFDYFGFTYVTSILLGGVAQQNIFIDREAKARLEKNSIDVKHEAKVQFAASHLSVEAGTSVTNSQQDLKQNNFTQEIQSIHASTLGGNSHLTTLTEWSKTVSSNPVIIEFALRNISRLLTKKYFPRNSLIVEKSILIEKALEKYISGSIYCYKNCGGNGTRGTCEPTGYFKFGICKCKPGWTGADCETVIEPPKIVHGTICGFDRSFMKVNCGGLRPWKGCPSGWAQYNWKTDLTICYKDQTQVGDPVDGTLCGLHSYQLKPYPFQHDIGCNITMNVLRDGCPLGYQQYIAQQKSSFLQKNSVCAVMDAKEHLSGTLCGMQVEGSINGPSCNGFHPGLRQCPSEYALQRTAFNDLGFMVCVKK